MRNNYNLFLYPSPSLSSPLILMLLMFLMTPVKDHILYHLIEFYLSKGMISVRLVFHSHGYMFPYSFLQTAEPDYRRLTLSQPVGLRHTGYVITVNNVIKVRGERE